MDARIVIASGTLVKISKHSGMKLYRFNGSLWAIFSGEMKKYSPFAYCWGKA